MMYYVYLFLNDIANSVTTDVSLFLPHLSLSPLDSPVKLCLKSEGVPAIPAGPSGPSRFQEVLAGPSRSQYLATFFFTFPSSQVAYESGDRPQDDLHLRGAKTCQDSTTTAQIHDILSQDTKSATV